MNDILISKIVGTPSQTSWSQASSTGKLYIALGLSSTNESEGIISKGKNILEQIQREFFAIDDKNLLEIKNAVEKVFSPLENDINYSAVIGAIKDDILYIVTASSAVVLIERDNNLAEVARGEQNKIIGFSGRLRQDDMIILQTNEFNKKISNKLLAEYTGSHDSQKLAEDIAPFILEDSKGEEAAIIVHFKNPNQHTIPPTPTSDPSETTIHESEHEQITDSGKNTIEDREENGGEIKNRGLLESFKNRFRNISKKQKGIIIFAILIVFLLLASLFTEKYMEQRKIASEQFNIVYDASSQKLESAKNLSSLNRGRALEEVSEAISNIENNLDKFSQGSEEYKKLSDLLSQLKNLRDELGGGSQIAGAVIFDASDSNVLDSISGISQSGDNLIIAGNRGFAALNSDGDIESEEEFEDVEIKRMISDDTYLYLLGTSVNRITISNGNKSEIIEDADAIDISYFGSNIYLLNNGGEVVKKYSGSSFSESNYFSDDINLSGKPISFAIDSSIYILTDDGNIRKFTRGTNNDEFELDPTLKISPNALLYANENLGNVYILDIDNASIAQISTSGSIVKQFNSLDLQKAKSFTVSPDETKAYVVIDDQVYSYDL